MIQNAYSTLAVQSTVDTARSVRGVNSAHAGRVAHRPRGLVLR
jgi:hypothetical protein